MMKPLKIYGLLLILFISGLTLSCSNDTNSIRIKNWKILYEQGKTLQSVLRKSGWQPVEIPLTVKLPYPPTKDFQYAWLKGEFDIKDDPSRYYGLSTGRIRFSDKIFVNNHLVGSLLPENVNWNPLPRNYIIHRGILKEGKNVVYIQLGIYGEYYGGILNDVLIQVEEDFVVSQFFSNLLYRHIPIGMVFVFASCVIPLIIIFFWNRKEKLSLYTLFGLSVYIIYMLALQASSRQMSFESFLAIMILIIPLFSIALILFIQLIYRVSLSNYNRIIIPLLLLFMIIMLLSRNNEHYYQISFILTNCSLIIIIPYLAFLIYRLNSIKHDNFLLYMIGIMSFFSGLIMIFEFYSEYLGVDFSDLPVTFSPMIFLIFFAVLFSREIMKRRLELELLYSKLKSIEVQEEELSTTDTSEKELSITDISEEKLKRVISFIDENFTSDISREGLALAVGISPNYMGTLFKTYTGKSINRYINELRIKKAMQQLESGSSKIIDVAFSVGFENSVNFNRVFKKVTGKTPSEYKKS